MKHALVLAVLTASAPDLYDAREDTLYRIYLIATVVGVLGAWAGIYVLYRQIRLSHNAERARVDATVSWNALSLNNFGRSAAIITSYKLTYASHPDDATADYLSPHGQRLIAGQKIMKHILMTGEAGDMAVFELNQHLSDAERTGRQVAVLTATVNYMDIFDEAHETRTVFRVRFSPPPGLDFMAGLSKYK